MNPLRWLPLRITLVWASVSLASAQDASGRAAVINGDTLEMRGVRIRLSGIDAPETEQQCRSAAGTPWPCGQDAAKALRRKIAGQPVQCDATGTDRYGRSLSVCTVDINTCGSGLNHAPKPMATAGRQLSARSVLDLRN